MVGIYKITNKLNNKIYIGQSVNIEKRWSAHRTRPFNENANQYSSLLYKAIRKYGLQNFTFEVIEECIPSQLDEKEKYYIQKYKSNQIEFGYNLTAGGQSATTVSKISESDLKIIYNLLINSTLSEEEISKQFNVSQRTISGINLGQTNVKTGYSYPLRQKKNNEKKYCLDCGKEISKQAIRCVSCSNKEKAKNISGKPKREILKSEIRNIPFTKLGEKYGVSDNAIKKWCISYNLPHKKSDIKSYSDKDWSKL